MKTNIENSLFDDFSVLKNDGELNLLRSEKYDVFLLVGKNDTDFICKTLKGSQSSVLQLFDDIASTDTPIYAISDIIEDFLCRNK